MRLELMDVNSVLSLPILLVGDGKPSADMPALCALKETRELLWRSAGVAAMLGDDTPDADTPETSDAEVGDPGHAAKPTADRIACVHAFTSALVSALSLRRVLSRNLITSTVSFSCFSAAPSNGNILRAGSPSCERRLQFSAHCHQ
jgi:hypothetical protein